MTLQELLPELSKLSVADKVEIIKRLSQEVAKQSAVFVPGAVYEVWSPYDSGEAAAQLQKMLDDYKKEQNA
jgi:hypothetical protein